MQAGDGSTDGAAHRHHRPVRFADLTDMIDAAGGTEPTSRAELAAVTAEIVVRAGRSSTDPARPGDTPSTDTPSTDTTFTDRTSTDRTSTDRTSTDTTSTDTTSTDTTSTDTTSADAGSDVEGGHFVALADRVGLDTLAALWRDADPVSLPGALWTLYLLRQWSLLDGEEMTRLWRLGEPYAAADAVVAGVADFADAQAVRELADAVLSGVYRGDLAVALERAAAFFRVVAAGRRCTMDPLGPSAPEDDVRHALELAEGNERAAAALTTAATRWRAGTLH